MKREDYEAFGLELTNAQDRIALAKQIRAKLEDGVTINTVVNRLTRVKRAALDAGLTIEQWYELKPLHVSREIKQARIARQTERVDKRNHATLLIPDPEALIDLAVRDLHSGAKYRTGLALMLLTGRRGFEVFSLGRFIETGDASVLFYGQAKTGRKEGAANRRMAPFEIPTLGPASQIVEAVDWLRSGYRDLFADPEWDQSQIDEVAARYHQKLNKSLGEVFHANYAPFIQGDGAKPHTLRAIYAACAIEWYRPRNIAIGTYLHEIMGHKTGDGTTGLAYQYIQLGG